MTTQVLPATVLLGLNADRASENVLVLVSPRKVVECMISKLLPQVPASNQPVCRAAWDPPENLTELVGTFPTVFPQLPPAVKPSFQLLHGSLFTHSASQLWYCHPRDWLPSLRARRLIETGFHKFPPHHTKQRGGSIRACRHSHWCFLWLSRE